MKKVVEARLIAYRLSLIAFFVTAFCSFPHYATAQSNSLYDQVKRITEEQLHTQDVEKVSQKFLSRVFPPREGAIPDSDVTNALRAFPSVCADAGSGDIFIPGPAASRNKLKTYLECKQMLDVAVRSILGSLQYVRTVGRDLQVLASSFEREMTGLSSQSNKTALRLRSIVNIWQSGIDKSLHPAPGERIRSVPFPDANRNLSNHIDDLKQKLGEKIERIPPDSPGDPPRDDREEFVAAVWRYRHGYRSVRRELGVSETGACPRDNEDLDGTQLQYLRKVWCDLERIFRNIERELRTEVRNLDPPLEDQQIAVFDTQDLIEGTVLWMRSDDVGLDFKTPLEPVLPALDCIDSDDADECVEDAILGGNYPEPPPEPEENVGLCSHPLASRGYLCRPIESIDVCGEQNEDDDSNAANNDRVKLATCKVPPIEDAPIIQTQSGPDICRVGGWKDRPEDDRQARSDDSRSFLECSHCRVRFRCSNECVPGSPGESGFASKKQNGTINVCLPETADSVLLENLAIHEMVHVQQMCGLPPEFHDAIRSNPELCCSIEYEAYLHQCAALAQDGILEDLGISPELCASVFVDNSCGGGANACTELSEEFIEEKQEAILEAMREEISTNGQTACGTLAAKLNVYAREGESRRNINLDPRLKRMINSLSNTCSPYCASKYENSIGNNLCYVGQCIEQGIEEYRIVSGRMTLTVGDEAYPYDACLLPQLPPERPQSVPVQYQTSFPDYNPERLVQELDIALCQSNGLPPLTPPVLCNTDLERRFGQGINSFMGMTQSLSDQGQELEELTGEIEGLTGQISLRIGGKMFADHFSKPWNYLGDLVNVSADLLEQVLATQFPAAMCPQGGMEDLCNELQSGS